MEGPKDAAAALDAIRQGGSQLVLNAHQRLNEVRERLDRGEFGSAHDAILQLEDRLSHLAQAETSLGVLANATLIRLSELEVGMKTNKGILVTNIEPCPCPVPDCDKRIVTFQDGHQMHVQGGWEVVIENG